MQLSKGRLRVETMAPRTVTRDRELVLEDDRGSLTISTDATPVEKRPFGPFLVRFALDTGLHWHETHTRNSCVWNQAKHE